MMSPELHAFLTTNDLDLLLYVHQAIPEMLPEDSEAVAALLQAWADRQAVSNLLMYPNLIPPDLRLHYIFQGLQEKDEAYYILAALVGLQRVDARLVTPAVQGWIVEQLIALIALDGGIIAERASAYLAGNLPHFQANHAPEVVRLLDHPNDAVRHNILVALIPLVGLAHIRPFIDDAVNSGLISPAARLAAEQKLAHVAGLSPDGMVDMALLDLGILETPLLSYLPNLDVGGA